MANESDIEYNGHVEPNRGLRHAVTRLHKLLCATFGGPPSGDGFTKIRRHHPEVRETARLDPPKFDLDKSALKAPLGWKRSLRIFVNSMSDLFQDGVPAQSIKSVWSIMERTPWHTYQVLTKRPERMQRIVAGLGDPLPNVWLGTSVENDDYLYRVDMLRSVPAHIRFVSFEPLLGPIVSVESEWNSLGNRRRRKWAGSSSDGSPMGRSTACYLPRSRSGVLLQTMGRRTQEVGRPPPRRPNLGRIPRCVGSVRRIPPAPPSPTRQRRKHMRPVRTQRQRLDPGRFGRVDRAVDMREQIAAA